jgi:transcription antitermination factor NusG
MAARRFGREIDVAGLATSGVCRSFAAVRGAAESADATAEARWYAVLTVPQNEKSAARQLGLREIESFLPTYESVRVWKNRQRVKLELPLFPSYLFVRIERRQKSRVLASPGVLRIVGNNREMISIPDATIDFLRSDLRGCRVEPYCELVVGQKVRIKTGAMEGLEGVLVRKNHNLRFVLTIGLINQHAAVEIDAACLEPVNSRS